MNSLYPQILGIIDTLNKWNEKLNAFADKYLGNVAAGTLLLGIILFVAIYGINSLNKK